MCAQRTILLISADDRVKRTTAIILMGAGFHLLMAKLPKEAIHLLETKPVDLVFFDVNEEPFDFLAEIHHIRPDIPLLTLGRINRGEEAEQWQQQYICLEKPADPELILDQVQRILA